MKIVHFLFLFPSVHGFWWIFLCCICVLVSLGVFLESCFFYAIGFINFHSVFCLSFVSGNETILVIWYLYAAGLCSVGWVDEKLMVVSVVVGFLNMSISRFEGFLIIGRSRRLMRLLFSCVGFSCILVRI